MLAIVIALKSGSTNARPAGPFPAVPREPFLGVNMHPLQDTYATYSPTQTLRLASMIGASIVRIDINWDWIEYVRAGTDSWYEPQIKELDAFLAEAARRHIRVLATVLSTPCWASDEPGRRCPPGPARYHESYPPQNPQDYADFLKRLIAHVGNKIEYYEIWNEPNVPRFWYSPDPAVYTRLLQAAYQTIKAENPSAHVLAGAISGTDANFIAGMYAAGAKGYFDALTIHPYSGTYLPDDCSNPIQSFRCGVEAIRRVMLQNGDSRPIWITEFGISVSKNVGPMRQATYVAQALSLIKRWTYVKGALWYELNDDPTGHDRQHFGLFGSTLEPRPAAGAFCRSIISTSDHSQREAPTCP
jgi:hypothetical protein